MRRSTGFIGLLAGWGAMVVCAAALAQTAPAPEQAPAAGSAGETPVSALIGAADPDGKVFRAEPPLFVVHMQSGALCPVGNAGFRLVRLTIAADQPRGDAVACDYAVPDGTAQVRIVRLGPGNADAGIGDAVRAWRAGYPGAGRADGPMWGGYPNLKNPGVASLAVGAGDQAKVASIWVADQSGWLVVVTATYPAKARHDTEIIALTESIAARDAIRKAAPPG